MDFGFSEDQELLRDSARKFLAAECPTTFVRKMMEDDSAHATELWKKAAELGWMGILIPEEHGGIGGSFLDLVVVMEEMGRSLMPGPFFGDRTPGRPGRAGRRLGRAKGRHSSQGRGG